MNTSDLLQQLASRLGVAVEHVYEVLTVQGTVVGAYGCVLILISFFEAYLAYYMLRAAAGKTSYDEESQQIGLIFGGIATALFAVGAFCKGLQLSILLFNPEFYALETIFEILKGS